MRSSPALRVAVAGVLACTAYGTSAVDRVSLDIGQLSLPGAQASGVAMALHLNGDVERPDVPPAAAGSPTLQGHLDSLDAPVAGGMYGGVEIICAGLIFKRPHFACGRGELSTERGPFGRASMKATAAYDAVTGAISFRGAGLKIASAETHFAATLVSGAWSVTADASSLDLLAVRKLAARWLKLPDAYSFDGRARLNVDAAGRGTMLRARLSAQTSNLNFTHSSGAVVGQALTASIQGTVVRNRGSLTADLEVQGAAGQALAGSTLLDFESNPLDLHAHAELTAAQMLTLTQIQVNQKDLVTADGQAQVQLGDHPSLRSAHFDVHRLEVPAAYRSFLQIPLATTDFGDLVARGSVSGEVDFAGGEVQRLTARLDGVGLDDPKTRFALAEASGELHWVADPNGSVEPSHVSWSRSSAYGLTGGAVALTFTARGTGFELIGDTRFPVLDGALVVHKLAARRLGAANTELDFDAHLEPISMGLLSKAFGWPVLSGQLAGRIPGVTYRDRILAVDGDLAANVFDGTIVGSRLRLVDPFGPWPRLEADVRARNLDLDLVTHTFPIGSITGRLDADITGLELFNWSPIAFDARLYTTPGDRSQHLISQKAVTSISNVGGGGGGVAAALQSGVLRFFKTFHYDRIGISCQLREEVCLMSGVEPARTGYYMVKGKGLPRIDIIGNAGRVDWPQLVSQITAGMHSQNVIVR